MIKYHLIWLILLSTLVSAQADKPAVTKQDFTLSAESIDPDKKSRNLVATVGDSASEQFVPKLEFSAWGGECRFSIDLRSRPDEVFGKPVIDMKGISSALSAQSGDSRFSIFQMPGGNLEWEIILDSHPDTNVFTFDIEFDRLRFSYQGELTLQELAMDAYRPDSVVGSYAVYHQGQRGDYTKIIDGDTIICQYGTGKAFHIFRPKAWDNKGDTTWCQLHIDTSAGTLSIIVPSQFLSDAAYPVIIDPQFGNTSVGGSNIIFSGYRIAGIVTMDSVSDQVLDSVVIYGRYTSTSSTLYGAIYTDDGGPAALGEANTTGIPIDDWVYQWWQVPMSGTYSLTSGATYWISFHCENYRVGYDVNGETDAGRYVISTSFPDPFGSATAPDWDIDLYGVYKAGSATAVSRRRLSLSGGQ